MMVLGDLLWQVCFIFASIAKCHCSTIVVLVSLTSGIYSMRDITASIILPLNDDDFVPGEECWSSINLMASKPLAQSDGSWHFVYWPSTSSATSVFGKESLHQGRWVPRTPNDPVMHLLMSFLNRWCGSLPSFPTWSCWSSFSEGSLCQELWMASSTTWPLTSPGWLSLRSESSLCFANAYCFWWVYNDLWFWDPVPFSMMSFFYIYNLYWIIINTIAKILVFPCYNVKFKFDNI